MGYLVEKVDIAACFGYLVAAGAFCLLTWLVFKAFVTRIVVYEGQAGLLYRNGRFVRRVGPGAYRILRMRGHATIMDVRRRTVTIPGQEILTADNVGLKVSMAASYEIEDPAKATHNVENLSTAFHVAAQLALRAIVAEMKVDDLLAQKAGIGSKLLEKVRPEAESMGLRLHSVEVKDVMFPGELKRIFAEVVRAQKEGLAALERARGETAALRNLANAASMVSSNPALMSLRVLQAMSNSSGNTFVLGAPSGFVPIGGGSPGMSKPDGGEDAKARGKSSEES